MLAELNPGWLSFQEGRAGPAFNPGWGDNSQPGHTGHLLRLARVAEEHPVGGAGEGRSVYTGLGTDIETASGAIDASEGALHHGLDTIPGVGDDE